jgi:uncharacterized DUF497 family protein
MELEWDETKRRSNLVAQGIDFEDAGLVWERPVLEVPSVQRHYHEDGILAIGCAQGDHSSLHMAGRKRGGLPQPDPRG